MEPTEIASTYIELDTSAGKENALINLESATGSPFTKRPSPASPSKNALNSLHVPILQEALTTFVRVMGM